MYLSCVQQTSTYGYLMQHFFQKGALNSKLLQADGQTEQVSAAGDFFPNKVLKKEDFQLTEPFNRFKTHGLGRLLAEKSFHSVRTRHIFQIIDLFKGHLEMVPMVPIYKALFTLALSLWHDCLDR